jgi:hypothetical protein
MRRFLSAHQRWVALDAVTLALAHQHAMQATVAVLLYSGAFAVTLSSSH